MWRPFSPRLHGYRKCARLTAGWGQVSRLNREIAKEPQYRCRGDETPLAGFDENTYVPAGGFESRQLASVIKEWMAVRDATVALVRGSSHWS